MNKYKFIWLILFYLFTINFGMYIATDAMLINDVLLFLIEATISLGLVLTGMVGIIILSWKKHCGEF